MVFTEALVPSFVDKLVVPAVDDVESEEDEEEGILASIPDNVQRRQQRQQQLSEGTTAKHEGASPSQQNIRRASKTSSHNSVSELDWDDQVFERIIFMSEST